MNDELAHLHQRLAEEGEKMLTFFGGLTDADWSQQVYVSGSGWDVHHVLAHFVSAEVTYLHYLRQTLAGGPGLPPDFDIDAFNESQVPPLSRRAIPALLADLRTARAHTVAVVAGLSPDDLERRGRHPWLGETDLRSVLKLLYRHPMIHLRDIRQALKSRSPVGSEGAVPRSDEQRA
jgi:hypothetical protein